MVLVNVIDVTCSPFLSVSGGALRLASYPTAVCDRTLECVRRNKAGEKEEDLQLSEWLILLSAWLHFKGIMGKEACLRQNHGDTDLGSVWAELI